LLGEVKAYNRKLSELKVICRGPVYVQLVNPSWFSKSVSMRSKTGVDTEM